MPKRLRNTHPAVLSAGVALAEAHVPPDVQELLIIGSFHGDRQISPGALAYAVTAARAETLEEVARWHDARANSYLSRRWTKKAAMHQISAVTIRAMKDDPSVG
jgi:hypothetical protein